MGVMKRFLIDRPVTNADGSQTYWVDAVDAGDAIARHMTGEGGMYADNCEVTDLGAPEISGETTLDDYGMPAYVDYV